MSQTALFRGRARTVLCEASKRVGSSRPVPTSREACLKFDAVKNVLKLSAVSTAATLVLLTGDASAAQSGNTAVLQGLAKLSSEEDGALIKNPFAVRFQRMAQARESLSRIPQFVKLDEYGKARLQLRQGPGMSSLRKDLRDVQMGSPTISSGMTTEVLQALEQLDVGLKMQLPKDELSTLTEDLLAKYDAVLGQLPR